MRLFASTIILMICLNGCQQINSRQSVKINDEVIDQQKQLMYALDNFIKALEEKDNITVEQEITALQEISKNGIASLKLMTAPKCDQQFIPAASKMFKHYNQAAHNEYKTIGSLYTLDSISYEEYDSLQILVDQFKSEQQSVNSAFTLAQKTFAKNCGFKLVKYAK